MTRWHRNHLERLELGWRLGATLLRRRHARIDADAMAKLLAKSEHQHDPALELAGTVSLPSLTRLALRGRSAVSMDALALRATSGALHVRPLLEQVAAGAMLTQAEGLDARAAVHLCRALAGAGPADFPTASWLPLLRASLGGSLAAADEHTATFVFAMAAEDPDLLSQRARIPRWVDRSINRLLLQASLEAVGDRGRQTHTPATADARWLRTLNRLYRGSAVLPLALESGDGTRFDRLRVAEAVPVRRGPLVSIIMTVFRPTEALRASVRSIIGQSWQDWELLLVDDASGEASTALLESVAQADPRIRLIRLERNAGTYTARNSALAEAQGEFVTFHDDDDWMHPQRLELQVQHLIEHADVPGNRSLFLRMTPDGATVFQRRFRGIGAAEATFLFRRTLAQDLVGNFDAVRKSGDTEFRQRLERACGVPTRVLDGLPPLLFARQATTTLSAGDFGDQWASDARLWYQAQAQHWHRTAQPADLRLETGGARTFPAPPQMLPAALTAAAPQKRPDITVIVPWCARELPAAIVERLLAYVDGAVAAGQRVGVAAVYTSGSFATDPAPADTSTPGRWRAGSDALMARVQQGDLQPVTAADLTSADRLLVSDPAILQFLPVSASWSIDAVVVAAGPADAVATETPQHGSAITPREMP